MRVERIKCGNANCFLLHGEDGAILIDTSRTAYREQILAACHKANVRLIVLTHGHVDHVQNAAYLSRELGVPIAMNEADAPLIASNFAEPMAARKIRGKLVLALSAKAFKNDPIEPFEPAALLGEGDSLKEYGADAAVIALPGHTKGSIGIVAGEDVFVGDALMNMFSPTKTLLYGDWNMVQKSSERISGLGAKTIHFGHGPSVANREW